RGNRLQAAEVPGRGRRGARRDRRYRGSGEPGGALVMADIHLGSMVMEDDGDGPAVVMVHGLGGTSNSFQTLMPALAGYRVLRPDLPGAGRSHYRPGVPGMAGLVAALKDALRA